MQQLGPARDWDVFAEATIARLVTAAVDVDLGGLREAGERQRKSSYACLPLYATHAPAKRSVKRLAKVQASLGRARDIASSRILLEAIRQDDQPALRLAVGAVAGWQARDRIAVANTLRKKWRRFKSTPSFWGR